MLLNVHSGQHLVSRELLIGEQLQGQREGHVHLSRRERNCPLRLRKAGGSFPTWSSVLPSTAPTAQQGPSSAPAHSQPAGPAQTEPALPGEPPSSAPASTSALSGAFSPQTRHPTLRPAPTCPLELRTSRETTSKPPFTLCHDQGCGCGMKSGETWRLRRSTMVWGLLVGEGPGRRMPGLCLGTGLGAVVFAHIKHSHPEWRHRGGQDWVRRTMEN